MLSSIVLAIILLGLAWLIYTISQELIKANSDDPQVWEKEIQAFEKAASKQKPPKDAVLFVGSSSIRFWKSLRADMSPIPVIQHGFGGSRLAALTHYTERLVNIHKPKVVVVFSGSNDITPKRKAEPQLLLSLFEEFVERVRADLADVPIYYIGITPSPIRWKIWPIAQQANRLIHDFCEQTEGVQFIDTTDIWLGADGLPDRSNYLWIDKLHPSKRGYANWTKILRPVLINHYPELQRE